MCAEKIKAYIAANLQKPITASDLAKAVGYSQYHMARMFKEETGLTPFEYLRSERLKAAADVLRKSRAKVVDVAFDFVFDSHEGFTRAFTRAFGITPKKYTKHPHNCLGENALCAFFSSDRRQQKLPKQFPSIKKTEVMEMNTIALFTQIIERPKRKLILQQGVNCHDYFSYCEEIGCGKNDDSAAWDILAEIKEALHEPAGFWMPDNLRAPGKGTYAHGIEVPFDYAGEIPEGFDVIILEPCKMLVFQGEPYNDENFGEAIGICTEQIKKFNPEVYGYKYAPELAPKMQLKPWGWRGYIEMYPVVEV